MNKSYSDSTLMKLTKKELIEEIRMHEYNYNALNECYKGVCSILNRNINNIDLKVRENNNDK